MFRLLGFCVGSLASLGVLFLVIGTPDFHLGDDEADRARFDEAVEKLKSRSVARPGSTPAPNPEPVAAVEVPPAAEPPPASEAAEAVEDPSAKSISMPDEPLPVAIADAPLAPSPIDAGMTSDAPAPEWHAFWTPFRTRIAAEGFVGRLENVTGLDYRVVGAGKTGYVVEFSYDDDTELDSKLERISAATGLELSRSLP